MTSRLIIDLITDLQAKYAVFDTAMKQAGIDYIVTCTKRSMEEQDALYAQGRNGDNRHIVTNARAGQSAHNFGMAFDIVLMSNGKCIWDNSDPDWARAGAIGKAAGLEWAGDWVSFKEYPHFQLPDWKTRI